MSDARAPALRPADLGIGWLFERLPDALVVAEVASGRIALWNPAAERLFGYTAAEVGGRSVELLIPERLRPHHRQGLARYRATGHGRIIDGTAAVEVPALRKTGEEITVELSLSPIRAAPLEGQWVLALIRDVSRRKRAEQALERLSRQHGLILTSAGEGIYGLDRSGNVTFINPAALAMLGHTAQELAGQPMHARTHHSRPDGAPYPRQACPIVAALTDGTVHRAEDEVFWRKDGSPLCVSYTSTPIREAGAIVGAVVIFSDITQQRQAQRELALRAEELARSNAELEQFAYVASHDLQEPLRAVVSYLQLLERRYRGQFDARGEKYISYAVDGARRMQQLIADLLAYSRVGRRGGELVPTDAERALEQALADLGAAIRESGAVVTRDPLPTLAADGSQLRQLFQNLLGNAIKFRGAEAPRIHVSATLRQGDDPAAERRAGEWLFAVRDNGIGIEPAYHERIFAMFQRLHSRAEYPGTGIGLAICRKIVERHGGRLWLESRPGRGTTFLFTIPANGGARV